VIRKPTGKFVVVDYGVK
jgi:hypothetical protein